jgi:hypothetical protein
MLRVRTNQQKFLKKIIQDRVRAQKESVLLVNGVAKEVLAELVRSTPVDTGRARSNWLVSVGSPRQEVILPHAPGRYLGIAETANASTAIALGSVIIDGRRKSVPIYITNSVDYLTKLDTKGTSKQAPIGFIQSAILRAVPNANKRGNFRIFRS